MSLQDFERPLALTSRASTRQEFARLLQKLMLERNWNQSDLARAASLGRDSISTYANGKTFPTPVALKKLADALGMQPHELMPATTTNAIDYEHPAVVLRQVAEQPGRASLLINRAMSFDAATRIIKIINDDDLQQGDR